MNESLLLKMLAEAFLRSALETVVITNKMDAEGRTKMTPEEKQSLRAATDAAAAAARVEGIDL